MIFFGTCCSGKKKKEERECKCTLLSSLFLTGCVVYDVSLSNAPLIGHEWASTYIHTDGTASRGTTAMAGAGGLFRDLGCWPGDFMRLVGIGSAVTAEHRESGMSSRIYSRQLITNRVISDPSWISLWFERLPQTVTLVLLHGSNCRQKEFAKKL